MALVERGVIALCSSHVLDRRTWWVAGWWKRWARRNGRRKPGRGPIAKPPRHLSVFAGGGLDQGREQQARYPAGAGVPVLKDVGS